MTTNTRARPSRKILDNIAWDIVDQIDKDCTELRNFTLRDEVATKRQK